MSLKHLQARVHNWGQNWNPQRHKWYQSWWIDPGFIHEFSVEKTMQLNCRKLFT